MYFPKILEETQKTAPGGEGGRLLPAGWDPLGGWLTGGIRVSVRPPGRSWNISPTEPKVVAGVLSCAVCTERCGQGGRPDFYLFAFKGCSGTDEQLGGSIRDAAQAEAAFQRLHARTN